MFFNLGSTIPVLMVLFLMGQSGHQKVEFTHRIKVVSVDFLAYLYSRVVFPHLHPCQYKFMSYAKATNPSYVILRHLTASYVILRESKYLRGNSKSNCSKEEREAATKDLHSDLK